MNHVRSECTQALKNIHTLLDEERWFPEYVFRGRWSRVFFFDSDWMFDEDFVELAQTLLQIDGGKCVCLANFDRTVRTDDRLFFIDANTSPGTYRAVLFGTPSHEGWLDDIGRFGCCSDARDWCLYSERASEIAVIAIRSDAQVDRFRPVLTRVHAEPIAEAIADPLSFGFEVLLPHWRTELCKQYG